MRIQTSTGNPIVDQVGRMDITGNIIPESWYKTIVNSKGKPNFLAIILLGDIVYWYRPTEIRDEYSNDITFEKKFYDKDYLQRSYSQIRDKFNVTDKQAREALILLENLGVVKRIFRDEDTRFGKMSNVMYLELIPSMLEKLTFIDENDNASEGINKKVNTSPKNRKQLPTEEKAPSNSLGNTNTKSTTENDTDNTTTTGDDVVDADVRAVLQKYNLSDSTISQISKEANNKADAIIKAVHALENYRTTVTNIPGFLIAAIRGDYKPVTRTVKRKDDFHNFTERDYDYDELMRSVI